MKLRPIREDEIEYYISKAEKYFPRSRIIHGLLSLCLKRQMLNSRGRCFVPETSDGPIFVVLTGFNEMKNDIQHTCMFWDPQEMTIEVTKKLLNSIPHWNWQQPVHFHACDNMVLEEIDKLILGDNGLGGGHLQKIEANEELAYTYVLRNIEVVRNLPSEFYLGPVSTELTSFILDHWELKRYFKEEYVKEMLLKLPSAAVYLKDKEHPVSWALVTKTAGIGLTFTEPEFRNRGFGGIVTLKLAEILLAENQCLPHVVIVNDNTRSISFHKKLGFIQECKIEFQFYGVSKILET